jgi:predicted ribosome quality control (RQC) complex YloA/Tae2 family protein
MKALSQSELQNIVDTTKVLVGCRLQEVQTAAETLVLAFWSREGRLLWLYVDLGTWNPLLLPFEEKPYSIAIKKNPMLLFLKAHFMGKILRGIELKAELGRVVVLDFGDDLELELRLFPHGQNVIARTPDKKISWDIMKEITSQPTSAKEEDFRDLTTLRDQWLALRKGNPKIVGKTKGPAQKPKVSGHQKALEKLERALGKVQEEVTKKREMPWRAIADWLVQNQTLAVPQEWTTYIDKRRKLSWNIDQCFERAKENEKKTLGTLERARKLELEIESLKSKIATGVTFSEAPEVVNPLKVIQAEGRSLRLSPDISVVAGKSAADNMKLLRKARAWDFWVHIKDHPSSHAIVFRNKKSELSQGDWHQVAQWFLRMTLGSKAKSERLQGEKFDLLIAECRHVTPIKGDRLGRVTYRNARTLPVRFQA